MSTTAANQVGDDVKSLEDGKEVPDTTDPTWSLLSASYLASVVGPFQPLYTAMSQLVEKYTSPTKPNTTDTTESPSTTNISHRQGDMHMQHLSTTPTPTPHQQKLDILDVGCGSGLQPTLTITSLLTQRHQPHNIIACDGSTGMVQLARKQLQKLSGQHQQQVQLYQIDITNISSRSGLKTESFDIITSALVIMHLPNPVSILSYYHTLLRHQGLLILAVWGQRHQVPWLTGIKYTAAKLSDVNAADGMTPSELGMDQIEPNAYYYGDSTLLETHLTQAGFHDIIKTSYWVPMQYDDFDHYFSFTPTFFNPLDSERAKGLLWPFVTKYGKLSATDDTRPTDQNKPFCLPSLVWIVTARK